MANGVSLLQCEIHPDGEHRGEKRVSERRHDQPHRSRQQRVSERLAASDVQDVLQPGETRADQARVHQAVRQRIELVASAAGHHEQQKQPLGRLFRQRCAESDGDGADRVRLAGVDGGFGDDLQYRRDDDGDRRTPQERQHQQPRRLRLPPVQPQVGQQDDAHGHTGQHESDGSADRVERGQRDHDQPDDGAQRDEDTQRRPDLADSSL